MTVLTTHHMAHASLDYKAAERLAKLCAMFSSNHPGERSNAAALADKFIRARGLNWDQVIAFSKQPPEAETLGELCGSLLAHREILNAWEIDFLTNISPLDAISPKQRDYLDRITAKVRVYRAAGCQA